MSTSSHRPLDTQELRPLLEAEKKILAVLLAADFPGKEALAEQSANATARRVDDDGSLEFRIADGPPAQVVRRIPVEAEAEDADGATVHILLHVVDGYINELELYRDGEGSVQRMPAAEHLRVIIL